MVMLATFCFDRKLASSVSKRLLILALAENKDSMYRLLLQMGQIDEDVIKNPLDVVENIVKRDGNEVRQLLENLLVWVPSPPPHINQMIECALKNNKEFVA
jgi:hypothetical protein